ncbi:mammalian cell entry protein [Mycolicibacterium moriokaense]|jgi:phospholipid/cholesterol/gamma-HCH transport system substrate-binding protein|uniref:Mce family protein Mce1B n=1 Tax=Mycolicibacterium moriokaense TaxID=39691 RepID=A0AAD1HAV7_9MYCO|nr:MlaD family protein [Mycolicibacterium moriokaense]MCV7039635.1 MCE family protein [Mycolicibacterium moriokaense]ORB19908.1 mammalian cell entry protein [Mycolicibacterium moriokaense]BBX01917.1 Mce family protein Mce1B [Mycolicibacterium moriokaense]
MKITGTAIRLGVSALILLLLTGLIIVVFGQVRFDRTKTYAAVFGDIGGLREGQFVRASGVEVGKVSRMQLIDGGKHVRVEFTVDETIPLYESTTASIRYADLIGTRYIELQRGEGEGAHRVLSPGGTIPLTQTQPALSLDALIGSFRPLLRSLDPEKVNNISRSLITVFQGQGGSIANILDQTAQLTMELADHDQAIGEVITNLRTVLATTTKHQKEFDQTVVDLEALISGLSARGDPLADAVAHISDAAGTVADLLADDRPELHSSIAYVEQVAQPLVDNRVAIDDLLGSLPGAFQILGRAGGVYGDFFNFYMCDLTLKINGLQPGGPVRMVKVTTQPTGRCTPK